jgi:hypothetical protein
MPADISRRSFLVAAAATTTAAAAPTAPTIDVWHGMCQRFGHLGLPQRLINILGSTAPAERIAEISYTLNGGDRRFVSKGPDLRRLAEPGDFNIEIDSAELQAGDNEVAIRAADLDGVRVSATVTVDFTPGRAWPLPYETDLSQAKDLQDVCQVIDGRWSVGPDGARPAAPYYDRVLGFGDMNWTDYSIQAEVAFHSFPGASSERMGPGFSVNHAGLTLRWRGHADDGRQPRVRWYPLGAATEFTLEKDLSQCRWRILPGPPLRAVYAEERFPIELEKKYWLKGEVKTMPDGRNRYRDKIWAVGDSEPEGWAVESLEQPSTDFPSGGALLITHRSDATFGRVRIERV